MIEGKKYHIITHRIPGYWNKPRHFVMPFIGYGPGDGPGRMLFFNGRECGGGTEAIEANWIASQRIVPDEEKSYLPKIYRG